LYQLHIADAKLFQKVSVLATHTCCTEKLKSPSLLAPVMQVNFADKVKAGQYESFYSYLFFL
jgi:hypothetical protein